MTAAALIFTLAALGLGGAIGITVGLVLYELPRHVRAGFVVRRK